MAIVTFENVTRVYKSGDHEQKALDGVNLSLEEGKFVVILGPCGAGKSTLLNLLGGLDSPTGGRITVNGCDISTLTANELADYRLYEQTGFSEDDIESIREIEGVDTATRFFSVNVDLADSKKSICLNVQRAIMFRPCL